MGNAFINRCAILLLLILNCFFIPFTLSFQSCSKPSLPQSFFLNRCTPQRHPITTPTGSKTFDFRTPTTTASTTTTARHAKKKSSSNDVGLEESVQKRLVSESLAPYRPLRLFLYGSFGSGAFVGGLITVSAVAAALSGARPDVDLNTEYMNLAIDFGAAAVFAFLFKFDVDKQAELDQGLEEKMEKKKEREVLARGALEREKLLGDLTLEIQVSLDGDTQVAPVRDLQAGAKQHILIVAGPKKACRDALIGANLLKMDFAMSNILVVPYDTDRGTSDLAITDRGFGDRPGYENQPYIARATGDGWDDYIQAEMSDAVKQSGPTAKEEGIAIVIANTGKVIRRGVGKVPWRQMVDQLEEEASGKKKESSLF